MGWGGFFHTLWEEGIRKPFRQIRRDLRRIWKPRTVFFGPSPSMSEPTTSVSPVSRQASTVFPQPRWHLCTGRTPRPSWPVNGRSPSVIQQEMRKRRLQKWTVDLLFFTPVFTLVSASLILTLWQRPSNLPRSAMYLLGVTGVGGMGLWAGFLVWARRRARRIAAWYQQDIFDLKERGTPLQRYLQRSKPVPAGSKPLQAARGEISEEDEGGLLSPLRVTEAFLETLLFGPPGGYIPSIELRRSRGLNLRDPTVQTALWLGGPCWWYLDAYSAVVLENPQGFFRILQGPTFPSKAISRLPSGVHVSDSDAQIQPFIPPEFYSWGFERLRRTFRFHPYTVAVHDHWLRSREGVRVKVLRCQVRAVPDFSSPTFLETLCTLVRREPGKDGQHWMEEWLEALEGRSLLQQEIQSALAEALNAYVSRHTLAQILHTTSTFPTEHTATTPLRTPENPSGLQNLRQRIEEALRSRGFRLEEVITFPQWEVPERIRQTRKALQRQFCELQRKEREIREAKYQEVVQEWCLSQIQGLIPLARELESGGEDSLRLARRALQVMWQALKEGLDFWKAYQEQWYGSGVSPGGPLPPFEDRKAFELGYRELHTLAALMHLHMKRLSLKGS